MCTIKTGSAISTKQDVINLVTALLLRQTQVFERQTILLATEDYLKGARLTISKSEINKIIDDDIDFMMRNNGLRCNEGHYSPQIKF